MSNTKSSVAARANLWLLSTNSLANTHFLHLTSNVPTIIDNAIASYNFVFDFQGGRKFRIYTLNKYYIQVTNN